MPSANIIQSSKNIEQDKNINQNDDNQTHFVEWFVVDCPCSPKKLIQQTAYLGKHIVL
ncbi:MAG: hypothetical protein U7123_15175 [Potamolinea sp.]